MFMSDNAGTIPRQNSKSQNGARIFSNTRYVLVYRYTQSTWITDATINHGIKIVLLVYFDFPNLDGQIPRGWLTTCLKTWVERDESLVIGFYIK